MEHERGLRLEGIIRALGEHTSLRESECAAFNRTRLRHGAHRERFVAGALQISGDKLNVLFRGPIAPATKRGSLSIEEDKNLSTAFLAHFAAATFNS